MHARCEQTLTPMPTQTGNPSKARCLPTTSEGDIILHYLQNPPTYCDFDQYRPDLAIQIER